MSDPQQPLTPDAKLGHLRQCIDRIDQSMHDLLIERSAIIDELIEVKRAQGGRSAFRPGREAQMMRHLAQHHHGLLPFDAIESIWRIIISTFTFAQSPYKVFAQADDALIQDTVRFHFGFTVPFLTCSDVGSVIAQVQSSDGDLGILPISANQPVAWWEALVGAQAPKVIARLPFVERIDHPAGLPAFVIAQPLAAAAVRDVCLYCARTQEPLELQKDNISSHGLDVLACHKTESGWSNLIAVEDDPDPQILIRRLGEFGCNLTALDAVGSHPARFQAG